MALRISASIIILFSLIFLPFYVSVVLALAAIVYFPKYWEAPVLFLVSDALYGAETARLGGLVFASFYAAIVILVGMELLKNKLKFYP